LTAVCRTEAAPCGHGMIQDDHTANTAENKTDRAKVGDLTLHEHASQKLLGLASSRAPLYTELDSRAARYRSTRRSGTSHMMATLVKTKTASHGATKASAMPQR
jgi:hypothetical protein